MNAVVRDTLDPIVGTIGERIIAALRSRSGLASLADIKKAVDCSNPALVEMQLASMRKRGDVYIPKPGYFQFTAGFTGSAQQKASAAAEDLPTIDISPTQEPTTMATKECNECHKQKDAKDFYTGNAKCKPCYNARQVARKTGATKPAAKPAPKAAAPKKRAAEVVEPPGVDERVIPASGAITCRVSGGTAEISQYNDVITCSLTQLANLVDWGQQALKRAAS